MAMVRLAALLSDLVPDVTAPVTCVVPFAPTDLTRRFVIISRSKNGGVRHIPLNSVALAAFKSLQKRSGTAVFVTMKGETLQGYKHWFEPAVEKAGVRDFTWYCLRHSFASRLVMKGVDLRTVQELMGHKNIQMTRRYTSCPGAQAKSG
jgi:site-specific recombinase XerD